MVRPRRPLVGIVPRAVRRRHRPARRRGASAVAAGTPTAATGRPHLVAAGGGTTPRLAPLAGLTAPALQPWRRKTPPAATRGSRGRWRRNDAAARSTRRPDSPGAAAVAAWN